MRPSSPPDVAGGWGSFRDTVLHFESLTPFSVDLRQHLARQVLSDFRTIGFERSFGVVTAQNPMGVAKSATVNAALAASLQEETAGLTVTHVCVDACSPDHSHCERSIAIALEEKSLIDIAHRYEQLAIFWFDGEAFWIIPVYSRNERLRLPVFV